MFPRTLLCVTLSALALPSFADTVWLKNGDRLTGKISVLDGGKLREHGASWSRNEFMKKFGDPKERYGKEAMDRELIEVFKDVDRDGDEQC